MNLNATCTQKPRSPSCSLMHNEGKLWKRNSWKQSEPAGNNTAFLLWFPHFPVPQVQDPVCGLITSPFKIETYLNDCFATCARARVLFTGECETSATSSYPGPPSSSSPSVPSPAPSSDPQDACLCITVRAVLSLTIQYCVMNATFGSPMLQ